MVDTQARRISEVPVASRHVGRTILAVVVGYLTFAFSAVVLFQLSGRDPHAPQPLSFVAFAVAYGVLFGAVGGYVAARLAPSRPRLHAAGVAIVLALGAAISLVASPGAGATWSQWAALALMAPGAFAGGWFATRGRRGEIAM